MFITFCPTASSDATLRRFYFVLLDAAGAAVTGASGTPEVSADGGALSDAAMGAATEVSDGLYYADLDDADTEGTFIAYWKPGTTVEAHAWSLNAVVVGKAIGNAMARLSNEVEIDHSAGTAKVYDADGVAGEAVLQTFTVGDGGTNKTKIAVS